MRQPQRIPDTGNKVRLGRRRFLGRYKQDILAKIAACKHGKLGVLLRPERLYHSHIETWRKQANADATGAALDIKRGRKTKLVNPPQSGVDRLAREVARLTGQRKQAQAVNDVQKKYQKC